MLIMCEIISTALKRVWPYCPGISRLLHFPYALDICMMQNADDMRGTQSIYRRNDVLAMTGGTLSRLISHLLLFHRHHNKRHHRRHHATDSV